MVLIFIYCTNYIQNILQNSVCVVKSEISEMITNHAMYW